MNDNGQTLYHVVPHFHYDVIYEKTYEEYLEITLNIIKDALRMMDKVNGYTFGVEQTLVLEEFINRYPHLKKKLATAIQNGQMEITCGMYVMPDMNLSSGESLIRQIRRGRDWLKATFGIEPRVCHITDCFGHHGQIPQIVKQCGYEYYVFFRGLPKAGLAEFWWKGIDGTKILTHWNYLDYGSGGSWIRSQAKKWDELRDSSEDIARVATTPHAMIMLGGDFCPPIPHSPQILNELSHNGRRAFFSTLAGYMDTVTKAQPRLRTIEKELNPVLEGCYTTRIYLKQENRFLENEVLTLEKLCALTQTSGPESRQLSKIWDDILLNQFHDTICGSIVDEANVWAEGIHRRTRKHLSGLIVRKMQRFAKHHTNPGSIHHVAVFNPLPADVKQSITFQEPLSVSGLINHRGDVLPVQKTDTGFLFVDSLPGLGLATYRPAQTKFRKANLRISPDSMENQFYRIQFTRGVISSLIHKETGRQFVNPRKPLFNTLALQPDQGDPWVLYQQPICGNNWQPQILPDPMPEQMALKEYFFLKTKHYCPCDRTDYSDNKPPVKITVVERGPVRIGLKIQSTLLLGPTLKVECEQCIYLYADLRRIDCTTRIVPHGKRYRIRACFSTPFNNPQITHEIPCGAQDRAPGEFPALNWVNYREKKNGLLVLNRGIPGNNFQDGVAMLSLFRSVAMEYRGQTEGCYGQGKEHFFEYAVIPYTDRDSIYPALEGQSYNTRFPTATIKTDELVSRSFLDLNPKNVVLSAFYRNENGYTIRIYESEGKKSTGSLKIALPVNRIMETDCLGNKISKDVPVADGNIPFTVNPFEIKTYWCG